MQSEQGIGDFLFTFFMLSPRGGGGRWGMETGVVALVVVGGGVLVYLAIYFRFLDLF